MSQGRATRRVRAARIASTVAGAVLLIAADAGAWLVSPGDPGQQTVVTAHSRTTATPCRGAPYELCMFDEPSGTPRLFRHTIIPTGGTCGTSPC
ncbi:MAG TPA: hypothetical protein VKA21_06255 [Candidatus Binatia bacterium]|nr:hypothetical protein [Candidatus Binatia bacterium]